MTASVTAIASHEPDDEGQLSFFDARAYKTYLFSLAGANKHSTEAPLKPGQHVSGRFTGTVVGASLEGFGSDTDSPRMVFKISADFVELG